MAKKILIVDDDAPLRTMLRAYLESKKFDVLEAANLEEAIELAVNGSPDAITLDFQMESYGDGSDVYTELDRDKRTTEIPVVIYSGADPKAVGAAFPLSSTLKFVEKPGNLEELLKALKGVTS